MPANGGVPPISGVLALCSARHRSINPLSLLRSPPEQVSKTAVAPIEVSIGRLESLARRLRRLGLPFAEIT